MIELADSAHDDALVAKVAGAAVRRELAMVRAAQARGESLALAYHAFRPVLATLMSVPDQISDRYIVARLQHLARGGIPLSDLEFLRDATSALIEMTKEQLL